ncbi:hypothetical protein M7I_5830 [Glarea lozoyensis 74030]|nr:hypothetical protein M7I_5830 [Glarea lozoyensis 74030]
MSVTQTYYLAHTARGKLSHEAARSDHNLRLLVGHANLLDSLMLELAEAEQEQESWFNQSVKKATKTEGPKHIQWADTIVEDPEEDWQAEDVEESDSDSEYDSDEDIEMASHMATLQRVASRQQVTAVEEVEEEFEDDEEEDYASLSLHRTNSHSATSPPELDSDSDSSEDESMPPSPPSTSLPTFSEKERRQIATTSYYSKSQPTESSNSIPAYEENFYLPQRGPGLVSAISVY